MFFEEEVRHIGSLGAEEKKPSPGGWAVRAGVLLGSTGLLLFGIASTCQAFQQNYIDSWQKGMAERLANDPQHNLLPGEKFYPRVKVVFPTKTANEVPPQRRINVRVLPNTTFGLSTPLAESGQFTLFDTPIAGTILPGSVVKNVVVRGEWGVAFCQEFGGLAPKDSGKPLPSVCTIHYDYILESK